MEKKVLIFCIFRLFAYSGVRRHTAVPPGCVQPAGSFYHGKRYCARERLDHHVREREQWAAVRPHVFRVPGAAEERPVELLVRLHLS